MNNKKILDEFKKIGGYRSPSSKVEDFLLKALAQQRQEIIGVVEGTKTPAIINPEPEQCDNCGEDIGLELYDSFSEGYTECKSDIIKTIKKYDR